MSNMSGGKYGPEVDLLMDSLGAVSVVLAVVKGTQGTGFSAAGPPEVIAVLPNVLRQIADQIEAGSAKVHGKLC